MAAATLRDVNSRQVLSHNPLKLPQPVTSMMALGLARRWLKMKGGGYRFTSMSLFQGLEIIGDKRNRGSILKILRGEGLIRWVKTTSQNQEGRNSGYGGLWEVMTMYEDNVPNDKMKVGEHFQTWSSRIRNDLIASGEWQQVILTDKGKYILERVAGEQGKS